MSRERVRVEMKRGGYMSLVVEGTVSSDRDGAGREHLEVEIDAIKWPGGGVVHEKNIADMTQVKEGFLTAVEGSSEAAYVDAWERAHDI